MSDRRHQPHFDPGTTESLSGIAPGEVVLGTLVGMNDEGRPLVDYAENPLGRPVAAMSTVGITRAQINRTVALLFAQGDLGQPIIIGVIHSPLYAMLDVEDSPVERSASSERAELPADSDAPMATSVAHVDGERVVIEGAREVVLKCGDASITLTRAGKILIRGKYVQSRSSGVNRIMGGSVQVN